MPVQRQGLHLAGRWLNQAGKSPLYSGLGYGAATAGAATLGNITSGEAEREGGGRLALEALGAGALGGLLGSQMPVLRRNVRPTQQKVKQRLKDLGPKRAYDGLFEDGAPKASHYKGARYAIGGIGGLAAGGLGGQIGGGNANIGNMLGIAGMEQNTIVDPEAYGSSNLRVY